jgi:hypothetical protein
VTTADPSLPCSVERRCSSAGKLCRDDDRVCRDDAVSHRLEVACEIVEPRAYVFCPAGAEQRDSNVVWILLAVAIFIAAIGGSILYFIVRPGRRDTAS